MTSTSLRKYHIVLSANKRAPQIADNVLRSFDCIISEPSSWILQGMTNEKGLTFLDLGGKVLHSSIFKHQAYFQSEIEQTEEGAIEGLIYTILFEHYSFEKADVKIAITKYR
jgi:hypothetical protein